MPLIISYIITEDDPIIRELTSQYLQAIPDLVCLGQFEDALSANQAIASLKPDLLITDVEMPLLNGIQLIKSLVHVPLIIIISAHKGYALDAFEVDAIDFLTKPIQPERLFKAIHKVRQLLELKAVLANDISIKMEDRDSFFIKEKNGYFRIHFLDVLYIESLADFVQIFLMNNTKKTALVSLKNLEVQLPEAFIRISRTHVINKQKISAIENNCILIDKIVLPIGKTYLDTVLKEIIGNSTIKRYL